MTSVPSSTTSPPEPGTIEPFTARSGAPSLRIGGRALHSPYDPHLEASRFVAEQLGAEPPSSVVVLGEGLGHVSAAIRELYPDARVHPVFYSERILRMAGADRATSWSPGSGHSLGAYFRRRLGELAIEGLRVVEWPASAQAFPEISRAAAEALRRVVQELNGSFATACAMGRLWFRNSVANFLGIDAICPALPGRGRQPVLIAAPGPSLERSAALIAEYRAAIQLWALPSSCPFLADAGLMPDLVVLSDPGHYAMHHILHSRVRAPVAMPLSAARGTWSRGEVPPAPFLVSQPVFYERALLSAAGLRSPEIAPHGTVAATAIDLALALCMRDISSHARPNAFDDILQLMSARATPHASLWFERAAAQHAERVAGASGARTSLSLRTYAGWFDEALPSGRVFRLLPSAVPLSGMRDLDADGLRRLLAGTGAAPAVAWRPTPLRLPSLAARRHELARLVAGWRSVLAMARPEDAWADQPVDPGAAPTALSMAFMLEPRGLTEALRQRRLGHRGEAEDAARKAFESSGDFLGRMARRVTSGD
jgi:hypothetical protein